jgi:organic hydroperoxide reductase OsmC/OhrA
MLWYLHLASSAGIVVTAYEDNPLGIGEVENSGQGRFLRAVLRPRITVVEGTDVTKADEIHHRTHGYCFIARSVRFPVRAEATYVLTRA